MPSWTWSLLRGGDPQEGKSDLKGPRVHPSCRRNCFVLLLKFVSATRVPRPFLKRRIKKHSKRMYMWEAGRPAHLRRVLNTLLRAGPARGPTGNSRG
jgi:hypothetical protein